MIKYFLSLFRKQRKQRKRAIPVTEIYQVSGHIFYQYENVLEIPAQRAIAAEVAIRQASMNMTVDVLHMSIDKCIDLANKGKIVDLFAILKEMKDRSLMVAERETLMQLATVYFLMDNEDESKYIRSEQQKKLDLFKENSDIADFFLQLSYKFITTYTANYQENILKYLAEQEQKVKRLLELIV
jgi:hypothetical protein